MKNMIIVELNDNDAQFERRVNAQLQKGWLIEFIEHGKKALIAVLRTPNENDE